MITSVKRLAVLAVFGLSLGATSPVRAEPSEATAADRAATAGSPSAAQVYEHVRRSVVLLERTGLAPAVGTVLGGDGRILTALSALGGVEMISVRYVDGTTVRARVALADPAADLALLNTEAGRAGVWMEGLVASEVDPVGIPLRVMLPAGGARLRASEAMVRRRVDVHSHTGDLLPRRLEIGLRAPAASGAPLLDSSGGVVGVLTRGCRAFDPVSIGALLRDRGGGTSTSGDTVCRQQYFGTPVWALRTFVSKAAVNARTASSSQGQDDEPMGPASVPPWLGIRGEADKSAGVHGVKVVAVAPSSPAENAGLKPGVDTIVSVDGKPVDGPEKLSEIIASRAAGDTIQLLVLSGGNLRTVQVELAPRE